MAAKSRAWQKLDQVCGWQLDAAQAELQGRRLAEEQVRARQRALRQAPMQQAAEASAAIDPLWREQLAAFAQTSQAQAEALQAPLAQAVEARQEALANVQAAHRRKRSMEVLLHRARQSERREMLQREDGERLEWALRCSSSLGFGHQLSRH
jgi:hypothetical protein